MVQFKPGLWRLSDENAGKKHCFFYNVFKTLLFTTQSQLLTTLKEMAFQNTVGKAENAGIQHFLLFPQCFLPF